MRWTINQCPMSCVVTFTRGRLYLDGWRRVTMSVACTLDHLPTILIFACTPSLTCILAIFTPGLAAPGRYSWSPVWPMATCIVLGVIRCKTYRLCQVAYNVTDLTSSVPDLSKLITSHRSRDKIIVLSHYMLISVRGWFFTADLSARVH